MNKFLWFAAGVAVGAAGSYSYIRKLLIIATADEYANEAREHYRDQFEKRLAELKKERAEEVQATTNEAAEALVNYQGLDDVPHDPRSKEFFNPPKPVRTPIDPEAKPPYVIGVEEFMRTEVGYEQISLTYFEGDETMADFVDEIVPPERVEQIIGADNLTRFGELSEDDNVVYVRCEKFNKDFEVTRSTGKYSVEVLGLSEGE